MSLYQELKRRNVIRVATAYVVAAWLVIQVIETIFPAFGFTDRALRVAVIVLGIGFVPAVIGAWVFEWTPEGLKRDTDAEQPAAARLKQSRRLDRGIIIVLVVAVSYFAVDKFVFVGPEVDTGFYGSRSIAVLPFENQSSDPEQAFFIAGVTDEIHGLLSSIRSLRVIAPRSSRNVLDEVSGVLEIGEKLNVGHLLEGSVRMAGNRVRVTATLVETATETQLWADTYEREIDDVFRIQDDIAANVVYELRLKLLEPLRNSRFVEPEVLDLVQRARQIFEERPGSEGAKMASLLEPALEIDPEYVPALQLMAMAEWFRWTEDLISADEMRVRQDAINARITALDPDNGFVEAGRAWDLMWAGDYEAAAKSYLTALEKDLTDPTVIRGAGFLALRLGKLDTSVRLLEHGMAIDPLCYQCLENLSRTLLYAGDIERAIEVREQYMAKADDGRIDYALMLLVAGQAERIPDLLPLDPEHDGEWQMDLSFRAMAAHSLGNTAEAERILVDLEKQITELLAADAEFLTLANTQYSVAAAAAWMGKRDRAFELLMAIAGTPFNYPRREIFSPKWRELRDDPRWQEYREAQGLSAERTDAIDFDPWLPE
jgi:TolB-like protein